VPRIETTAWGTEHGCHLRRRVLARRRQGVDELTELGFVLGDGDKGADELKGIRLLKDERGVVELEIRLAPAILAEALDDELVVLGEAFDRASLIADNLVVLDDFLAN
jgi:hypothetical protein